MVVVLPVPFTPTTRITSGVPSTLVHRLRIGGIQDGENLFLQQPLEFVHISDLLAVGLFAQFFQHFMRGGRAQVSPEQRGFKIVQRVPVDLLAEGDYLFDALASRFSRVRVTASFMRSRKLGFCSSSRLPKRV